MTHWQPATTIIVVLAQLTVTCGGGRLAAAPTTRPAEARAERVLAEEMSKLDADYRAKKADILRRYVAQMTVAKRIALRAGDREEAQRIFDAIAAANAKVAELAPPAPADGRPEAAFRVTIGDFNGAAGLTNVVTVTRTDISITAENDFGRPSKVVWTAKLTPEQQHRLADFLRAFPLDQLDEAYIDPTILDGTQISFAIQLGEAPARKISVMNQRQRDLQRLIDEVNDLLPPKYLVSGLGG